jgi:hypothetical protein
MKCGSEVLLELPTRLLQIPEDFKEPIALPEVYAVKPESTVYHQARSTGHHYETHCGLPVSAAMVFDMPQDDLPVMQLCRECPLGWELCASCRQKIDDTHSR